MSASLLGGPIAVIDFETTGLFPHRHDRVVEVAAVVVNGDGTIEREFVSLVNPVRDIGPSSIHGLASEDILHAPRFEEVASLLLDALSGTVAIAAHNVRFDRQFLDCEFSRLERTLPDYFTVCTMQLAGGGKLSTCCRDYGIPADGDGHNALNDARAAARLLVTLLADDPRAAKHLRRLSPIAWPSIPPSGKQPITRDQSRQRHAAPPSYLQRLLERKDSGAFSIATDGAVMAYGALLDRVLEDRQVDHSEADALVAMAGKWGLNKELIEYAHRDYLNQLAIAAVADGVVTDSERRDLKLVARLLGQEKRDLNQVLAEAATARLAEAGLKKSQPTSEECGLAGKRVCFTGELQSRVDGQLISRERAEELAVAAGLSVLGSVTKKLDLLVLADPHSQSGKAKKAREYGVRIMHEPVFWKAIGVAVT